MTLSLLKAIKQFRVRHHPTEKLQLRIGVHSGNSNVANIFATDYLKPCVYSIHMYWFYAVPSHAVSLTLASSLEVD